MHDQPPPRRRTRSLVRAVTVRPEDIEDREGGTVASWRRESPFVPPLGGVEHVVILTASVVIGPEFAGVVAEARATGRALRVTYRPALGQQAACGVELA